MAYDTSAANRLIEVRASIAKALRGESYSVIGVSRRLPSLKDLRELEKELMDEVDRESNGIFSVAEVATPT